MTYRIAILDDNAADLQRTEEMLSAYSAAHPAGNGTFEKGLTYGQSFRYFMDILQAKWNSRREG